MDHRRRSDIRSDPRYGCLNYTTPHNATVDKNVIDVVLEKISKQGFSFFVFLQWRDFFHWIRRHEWKSKKFFTCCSLIFYRKYYCQFRWIRWSIFSVWWRLCRCAVLCCTVLYCRMIGEIISNSFSVSGPHSLWYCIAVAMLVIQWDWENPMKYEGPDLSSPKRKKDKNDMTESIWFIYLSQCINSK